MARVVNGVGASSGASLSDATPEPTGTAVTAGPGTATGAARADHVHATEVTIAGITDAGAAGADVLAAATAAAARAAIFEAVDALTGSGWTSTNGNGTASVSGGAITLAGASGADLTSSYPQTYRSLAATTRGVVWRIAAFTGDAAAELSVGPTNPGTSDVCNVTVKADGSGGSTVDTTISMGYWDGATFTAGGSGVVARDGTWWVWQDYSTPGTVRAYVGKGTTSTPPDHLAWALFATNSVASGGWGASPGLGAVWTRLAASLYKPSTALGSTTSVTVDGLVVLS